jgi:hypothetical protein
MLLQPEARPITQDQLVNEVMGIYAGLVMVEKKCVEIDQQQRLQASSPLNNGKRLLPFIAHSSTSTTNFFFSCLSVSVVLAALRQLLLTPRLLPCLSASVLISSIKTPCY